MGQLLVENTRNSLVGLGMVVASVPVYAIWMRVKKGDAAPAVP
jgi:hypothetical protein